MLHRTLGVIGFIGVAAAAGVYFANRPTVARGHVIAADLMQSNKEVKAMKCDDHIPLGADGGKFVCGVEFNSGGMAVMNFKIDRNGQITALDSNQPHVKKTSDPWGD